MSASTSPRSGGSWGLPEHEVAGIRAEAAVPHDPLREGRDRAPLLGEGEHPARHRGNWHGASSHFRCGSRPRADIAVPTMVRVLSGSSRNFVRNKEVAIEAEEEHSLIIKVDEFSKPGVCLFPGYAFASDHEACHDTQ